MLKRFYNAPTVVYRNAQTDSEATEDYIKIDLVRTGAVSPTVQLRDSIDDT